MSARLIEITDATNIRTNTRENAKPKLASILYTYNAEIKNPTILVIAKLFVSGCGLNPMK